ncbi:MAG: hypothetical protein J7L14_01795 [Candidatus Diapherotrites archaeon]|nr:hypothetical protein [Candidatus Diapherotrites archaeon]
MPARRRKTKRTITSKQRKRILASLEKIAMREVEPKIYSALEALKRRGIKQEVQAFVDTKLQEFARRIAKYGNMPTENTFHYLASFLVKVSGNKNFKQLVEAVMLPLSRAYSFRPAKQCEEIARAALRIIEMMPRIDAKRLAKYIIRLSDMPLVENMSFKQLVDEYLRRIKERSNKVGGIRKYDNTRLYISGRTIIRNMPPEAFECWQELARSGLPVEPIEWLLMPDEQIAVLGRYYKRHVVVASKRVGHPLESELPKLRRGARERIFRQIVDIAAEMWSRGIFHNHMHAANFTINWEGGIPRVYLIDFNEATRADPNRSIREQIYEGKFSLSRMGYLLNTLQKLRNMPRNATEQIVLTALYKRLAKRSKQ